MKIIKYVCERCKKEYEESAYSGITIELQANVFVYPVKVDLCEACIKLLCKRNERFLKNK
jgi:hypothetical protein